MAERNNLGEWVAAMKDLPSLTDDIEHYRKTFLAMQPVLQKHVVYEAIINYFDSNLVERLTKAPNKEKFIMLAIGLGEGKHELHMLKNLSPHFTSSRLIAVDPNKGMLDTFCEKLNSCNDTKNVECYPFPGTFEEFLESSLAGVKFDLISSIHSMYYLGDLTNAVEGMLSRLSSGGILMADVLSDGSIFDRHLTQKPWLNERTSWRSVPDRSIKAIAKRNEYTVITHRIPITYDCSLLLDKDSVEGNLHLDFFAMTPHFRRDAPTDIVEDDLSFWRENLEDNEGRLTACSDDSLLIISK